MERWATNLSLERENGQGHDKQVLSSLDIDAILEAMIRLFDSRAILA